MKVEETCRSEIVLTTRVPYLSCNCAVAAAVATVPCRCLDSYLHNQWQAFSSATLKPLLIPDFERPLKCADALVSRADERQ